MPHATVGAMFALQTLVKAVSSPNCIDEKNEALSLHDLSKILQPSNTNVWF